MGRGSSKAGGGGGGAASNVLPPVTTQVVPPTPQQVAEGNVLPQGGIAFDDFEKMTDDEKADVVEKALGVGVPLFLDDSGIQRFAYFTGMSDKPNVVSDAQLDQMSGQQLFRTMNNAYNPRTDIGYTSKDIAKQISEGDFTMYSDSGRSAHGKAIYFADNYYDSSVYGDSSKAPSTMRAKITGGKSISESALSNQYHTALARGDKLAKACSKADSSGARNLYGLAKGYDVITPSGGYSSYYMVLNRRCLSVSSTIKKTNIGGSNW